MRCDPRYDGAVRRVALVLLVWGAANAASACQSFGSGSDDATVDASDAKPPPPQTPPPAPQPADAASDGTLFFDDFESGDCSAWEPFISNISPITVDGRRACLICRTSDAGARPNGTRNTSLPSSAGPYELSFAAKPVDAGTVSVTGSLILELPDGGELHEDGNFVGTTSDWTTVTNTFAGDIGADAGRVVILGDVSVAPGQCFLFDDVRLVSKNP